VQDSTAHPAPPSIDLAWRAIETYLSAAYGNGPIPAAVQTRITKLRTNLDWGTFYACDVLERDPPDAPRKWRLRLGNRFYPHMKLVIEPQPDGQGYLFRADTHDQHACPKPDSREYAMFCQLMEQNRTIATAIEHAWIESGIPTFKSFLQDDLKRRAAHA
jgi:hypothetical protein